MAHRLSRVPRQLTPFNMRAFYSKLKAEEAQGISELEILARVDSDTNVYAPVKTLAPDRLNRVLVFDSFASVGRSSWHSLPFYFFQVSSAVGVLHLYTVHKWASLAIAFPLAFLYLFT